ncbi:glycosyltransferase [Hymenobacter sp. HMF4947]|uniref:Glycosyltransferase n=1 Tax=Hymenobacter ginkgonis TaxID=2682976 RepID=A0A7K1TBF2_9BACT|nr:glycosyltransferase family 2 protein [Hymenobacter ginkgonis]MVN75736.1 glycosyltransferase [Hymenobacter ginkgonis]
MALFYLVGKQDWVGYLGLGAWYAVQGYVLLFCAYVLAPAVLYVVRGAAPSRRPRRPAPAPQTNFVLLVPAHNEQELLPGLLASIAKLNYPAARFRTVVVADNCTDRTARLARQAGAECLVRTTPYPSNKSQALAYAATELRLVEHHPAAVVCVLDADCRLDAQFLAALDRQFARPGAAPVVQSSRRVANAFESDVTVLDAAAEALRQQVGAGGRRRLGLEAFIFGLGCCLRAPVFTELMALPITSLAEDKEWKAYLASRRIPVAYCPEALLSYQAVGTGAAFAQQRKRWLSGHVATVKAHGLAMLGQGLGRGNLSQVDFACDLLQVPRSCLLVAALVFAAVASWAGQWSLLSSWGWLAVAAGLLAYAGLGLRLIGAAPRHWLALLSGVGLVVGVAKSLALIVVGYKDKDWKATRPVAIEGVGLKKQKV